MYTLLKRLLIEILTLIMAGQADKIGERERLNDEEIIKIYGKETIIFKTFNIETVLTSFRFLYGLIVFCITITIIGMVALRIFVPEQFQWKITAILLLYIPIIISCKIVKTIYVSKKDIITKENIIMQRAFKEDRIVTYNEIKQANQSKKIKIKKAIVYIPINRGYIQIPMADVIGDLAILKIRQRSKIYIPEFTKKRKKYMGQASTCGLYNFFGFLFFLALFPAALLRSGNSLEGFINNLLTEEFCIGTFIAGAGCFLVGKLHFSIGQYKLKKDINDSEHVTIKLF